MIQALGENIIVKAMKEPKKTTILTLDNEKPDYFEVISVGKNVKDIFVGDHVLTLFTFNKVPYHDDLYVTQQERIYGKKILD